MSIPFQTAPALILPGIRHGFFTRNGGVSKGQYSSLNAGYGADEPAENVRENRSRIAAALGTSEPSLLSCHQYHSTDVMIADGPWDEGYRPKADAVVTKTPGIACSALSADCAPVLFADSHNGVIGTAHAGWRGALAGITDATVKAMEAIGADRKYITAIVGPCISGPNYEVGPEFRDEFLSVSSENTRFFTPGRDGRLQFDLKAYVVARLRAAGLAHAESLPDCTYGDPETYFSYRYNCHNNVTDYGRNISAITLSA